MNDKQFRIRGKVFCLRKMSLVHYKFKSGLDYQHVKFDGLHISVADMKKEIVAQRQLRLGDFELEIANAQTGSGDDFYFGYIYIAQSRWM